MPKHQCKAQNAEQVIQFNVKLHHLIFFVFVLFLSGILAGIFSLYSIGRAGLRQSLTHRRSSGTLIEDNVRSESQSGRHSFSFSPEF